MTNWRCVSRRSFLNQVAWLGAGIHLGAFKFPHSAGIKIGLVTDSHYADREPANNRYYRQALDKMKEFIQVVNEEGVDLIMHMGDFKDEDPNQRTKDTLDYLRQLEAVYGLFAGPRYHCVGNHDVDSITKSQFLKNIENSDITNSQSYYSFDLKGFHFTVLDANFHRDGRHHFYRAGADWQDTNITGEQMEWLRQDLESTSLPTLVFCHHPLFEYFRDGLKFHVNQFREVQSIMEKSGKVLSVFQGHVHEERYQRIHDINYYTQNAMVDFSGLENNSFSIVEVQPATTVVRGFKRVSDMKWGG